MIWLRRGRKIVRARSKSGLRSAALAALASLFPAHAFAAPPRIASNQAPTAVSTALRSLSHPDDFAASTTAAAHRIALPDGPPLQLRFSVLEGTIELRTSTGPLHARLPLLSTPCRPIDPTSDEVRLRCESGRIDAALVTAKGHRYLDLRELRGLPTDDGEEGPPRMTYPLELLGATGACPGDSDASRGECAFDRGEDAKAQAALTLALKQQDPIHRFAALRLGDLALRRRDPNTALAWYLQAGDQGLWGRLASERVCEVTGSCFDDSSMVVFDSVGLPEPVRAELELREIRMLALLGRWSESMEHLANLIDAQPGSCIDDTKLLCRRLTLAALRTPSCPRESALSTYLRLPAFLGGPLAPEMAQAAGHASGALGAPAYGAALLSATSRQATRADLLAHAKETIALYTAAGDPFRAHVMWSWAATRLTPQEARELPPDNGGAPIDAASANPSSAAALAADLEADEAATALTVARSTLARSRISAPEPPPAPRKRH